VDALNREALEALTAAVRSFLPAAVDPALAPSVAVFPKRIAATGIGGLVGLQQDPEGEIAGRQITAAALNAAAEAASQELVAAGRQALGERGLLSVQLSHLGEKAAPDGGNPAEMDLSFAVHFEWIKRPEEAGGVIREIPIDLRLSF
jgi:hypothetical protein